MVRTLQFTTVGALSECFRLQRIMAAAHAPAGRGGFSFRDSHFGTCSKTFEWLSQKGRRDLKAGGFREGAPITDFALVASRSRSDHAGNITGECLQS
ncbi:hypothetical protein GGR39_001595 [Novosphingobium fluoreni]|uniref:Uncharacterized protein n=1 Tax=Novosphingobium fluoreni TaxID=1391222 RepID=A0A7W6FYD1_9SPHN|nr:hypothetical protein [Novosphingobium fluoreni]